MIIIDDATEMTKEMWEHLGKVMGERVMSLGKPVVHVEGRTTCTFECQYEEFKKENDLLRKALLDMSGYISRADMYYLKPETLIALKEKE